MIDDPTRFLTEPPTPPDDVEHGDLDPALFASIASLSARISDLLEDLFDFDPLGDIVQVFLGDWEKLHQCGAAFNSLSLFSGQLIENLQHSSKEAGTSWQGGAAESAQTYFADCVSSIRSQQTALLAASKEYVRLSFGINVLATQVQGLLELILDRLIIAGIAAAAGTALSETVIGGVAGYGVAAWQVIEVIQLINRAATKAQAAVTLLVGGGSFIAALTKDLGEIPALALPDLSYHHPALT
ncbi:hypothetical protein [Catellatospora sichuanensis]|uniref:hypothetical protein n=1 Tax=Catellatospora sichuanensis TaxID=1969805 RepID=UPI001182A09C|nr:hypothetical protein [Catellatospora sichuanensis]